MNDHSIISIETIGVILQKACPNKYIVYDSVNFKAYNSIRELSPLLGMDFDYIELHTKYDILYIKLQSGSYIAYIFNLTYINYTIIHDNIIKIPFETL